MQLVPRKEPRRFLLLSLTIYTHLWIVEGALRKWIPVLADGLYVLRDITLIAMIFFAFAVYGKFGKYSALAVFVWASAFLLATYVFVQIIAGLVSLPIGIFGLRNYLAPFLALFLVWRAELIDYLPLAARIIAHYAPFQFLLVVAQVNSPVSGLLNAEVGGEETIFTTAFGVARASGTFSAPAGLIAYVTLAIGVAIFMINDKGRYGKLTAWSSFISAVGILVIAGSRGAVFAGAIVVLAWLAYGLAHGRIRTFATLLLGALVGAGLFVFIARQLPEVVAAFGARFENAAQNEDTLRRVQGGIFNFFSVPLTPFGDGAGSHSTIGISLGSTLPWVEGDSARWVSELGILGLVLATIRIFVFLAMGTWIVWAIRRETISTLILTAILLPVGLAGSISTSPSTQGFFSIAGGMLLASILPPCSTEAKSNLAQTFPTQLSGLE